MDTTVLFAADLVSQEEMKQGNVVYSLLIGAVLLESLQIAPQAFLELLRPDWVSPPEGKCGAAGTTSASDQIAGLPSLEGCFTTAMVKIRLGSQPGWMSVCCSIGNAKARARHQLEPRLSESREDAGRRKAGRPPGHGPEEIPLRSISPNRCEFTERTL